jgi:hypothetical protein
MRVMSEGLSANHTLIGIHVYGNEGSLDAGGYIIVPYYAQ